MSSTIAFPVAAPAPAAAPSVKRRRRRQAGTTLEPGIEITATGFRAWSYHEPVTSKRYNRDTNVTTMRAWRAAELTRKLDTAKQHGHGKPIAGTFAEDVATYLKAKAAMPSYAERVRHMAWWVQMLGADRKRDSIEAHEIQAALHAARKSGKAAIRYTRDANGKSIRQVVGHGPLSEAAVNHRRAALQSFFTVMNGKVGANPVDGVDKFVEPDPKPRGVEMAIIERILARIRPSPARARLTVIAWTGIPHITLARVRPADVDYEAGTVYLTKRLKGGGTKARVMTLLPQAVEGFRQMREWDAWANPEDLKQGKRLWQSLNRAVARACTALNLPVITSYDFRHSFGTAHYEASGDIKATQEALGHSTSKLTERYTLKAHNPRQAAALAAMQAKYPAGHRPAPRTKKTKKGKGRAA